MQIQAKEKGTVVTITFKEKKGTKQNLRYKEEGGLQQIMMLITQ